MFTIDNFSDIRSTRQVKNYDSVLESGYSTKHVNKKALHRVCDYTSLNEQQLKKRALDDPLVAKLLSMLLAINASRQGVKDEEVVINGVAKFLSPRGVDIKMLGVNELVPIKGDSSVLDRDRAIARFGKEKLLKSFDFYGKIRNTNKPIYGFAKICLGNGGHQDNVYAEAREVIEWAHSYGDKSALYVFLIDTDDNSKFTKFEKLASNKKENIWICSHKTFQEKILPLTKKS